MAQVRVFLAETLLWGTSEPGLGMCAEVNREFSAVLAQRGWVGMAVPARTAVATPPRSIGQRKPDPVNDAPIDPR